MATTLLGRTINCVPRNGEMNTRDPDGDGVFDPNDPGEIFIANATMQVDEDVGTASIPIERTGGTGAASVDWTTQNGTATSGTDYTASSGTLNWDDLDTGVKNAQVPITDQTGTPQGDLDFDVVISNASGAPIREDETGSLENTTTVTIRDLDGGTAEEPTVIWNGDFSDGKILVQYPAIAYWGVLDDYEPPAELDGNGDGSQLNLVTPGGAGAYFDGPVRSGDFAARFRLPNSSEGGDTQADPLGGNTSRRRTEVHQREEAVDGKGLNFDQTRWFSASYFVPSDWDVSFNDFKLIVLQCKHLADKVPSFTLRLSDSWAMRVNWAPSEDPSHADIEWWMQNDYEAIMSSTYDDLIADFPDEQVSKAALASVNRGGWTDWAIRVRPDHRSAHSQGITFGSGGNGSLDVWKREGSNAWVHVLEYLPRVVTVASNIYSRGVWLHDSNSTHYMRCGMYAPPDASVVLNASPSREFVFANYRIYGGGSTLTGIEGKLDD